MQEFSASCVWQADAELGEGPLWVPEQQRLYFVDILGARLLALDPASGERHIWNTPDRVCWIVPEKGGDSFLVGLRTAVVRARFNPELSIEAYSPSPELAPRVRLNDAKVDRHGHLWFGSMDSVDPSQPAGILFRLGADGQLSAQDQGIHICNGPTFSLDGATMYHADSLRGEVRAYPVDARGLSGPSRLWRSFDGASEGSPDGMTVDAEGGIWIAQWGGGRVCRYLPDGTLDMVVRVPVSQPSSCTFGGPALSTLYITSAKESLSPEQLAKEALAGSLFAVELPVAGLPANRFG
jgi:xylono-1,5-lactonase